MSKTSPSTFFGRLQQRALALALAGSLVPLSAARSMPYVVQPGDTLETIAAKHGTDVVALLQANPQVSNPNLIFPDEVITVANPPLAAEATSEDPVHRIRRDETLARIAARYDTTVATLLGLNPRLHDPDHVYAGEVIRVPFAELPADYELRDAGGDVRVFFTGSSAAGESYRGQGWSTASLEGTTLGQLVKTFNALNQLEVYGRPTCGRTIQTVEHLQSLEIEFTFHNIDHIARSEWPAALYRYDNLPVLKRGGQALGDFKYLDDITTFVRG